MRWTLVMTRTPGMTRTLGMTRIGLFVPNGLILLILLLPDRDAATGWGIGVAQTLGFPRLDSRRIG
jgi:hypothetical protein